MYFLTARSWLVSAALVMVQIIVNGIVVSGASSSPYVQEQTCGHKYNDVLDCSKDSLPHVQCTVIQDSNFCKHGTLYTDGSDGWPLKPRELKLLPYQHEYKEGGIVRLVSTVIIQWQPSYNANLRMLRGYEIKLSSGNETLCRTFHFGNETWVRDGRRLLNYREKIFTYDCLLKLKSKKNWEVTVTSLPIYKAERHQQETSLTFYSQLSARGSQRIKSSKDWYTWIIFKRLELEGKITVTTNLTNDYNLRKFKIRLYDTVNNKSVFKKDDLFSDVMNITKVCSGKYQIMLEPDDPYWNEQGSCLCKTEYDVCKRCTVTVTQPFKFDSRFRVLKNSEKLFHTSSHFWKRNCTYKSCKLCFHLNGSCNQAFLARFFDLIIDCLHFWGGLELKSCNKEATTPRTTTTAAAIATKNIQTTPTRPPVVRTTQQPSSWLTTVLVPISIVVLIVVILLIVLLFRKSKCSVIYYFIKPPPFASTACPFPPEIREQIEGNSGLVASKLKIFVLYEFGRDEAHHEIVLLFCRLLSVHGDVNVTMADNATLAINKRGNITQWIVNEFASADRIVIINSRHSRDCYNRYCSGAGAAEQTDRCNSSTRTLFATATDLLEKEYEINKSKLVNAYFAYDDPATCLIPKFRTGVEHRLMFELAKFYLHLHGREVVDDDWLVNNVRKFNFDEFTDFPEGRQLAQRMAAKYDNKDSGFSLDSGINPRLFPDVGMFSRQSSVPPDLPLTVLSDSIHHEDNESLHNDSPECTDLLSLVYDTEPKLPMNGISV
ncbi:uncharacterized protein LOC141901243 isoform X2 [Tubulanus polymorphus]|uniref:uncharacterized protein LOC141901243 isoform X2 n=1 Tax=Tubulanus polymorphus TaxID=672921 RepID=UPI003DA5B643